MVEESNPPLMKPPALHQEAAATSANTSSSSARTLQVKWKSEVFEVEVPTNLASFFVDELKQELFALTEVLPHRQKLVFKGKTLKDEDAVSKYLPESVPGSGGTIKVPAIMLLGSREQDVNYLRLQKIL